MVYRKDEEDPMPQARCSECEFLKAWVGRLQNELEDAYKKLAGYREMKREDVLRIMTVGTYTRLKKLGEF